MKSDRQKKNKKINKYVYKNNSFNSVCKYYSDIQK